jgi:hypothetical protein
MRPSFAGPASLVALGASILVFALTADVWEQAEPFRVATLTSQQALTPAGPEGTSRPRDEAQRTQRRPTRRAADATVSASPETAAARPIARVGGRTTPATSRAPEGAVTPRPKARLRRKPPAPPASPKPVSPVPPVSGGTPTPPQAPPPAAPPAPATSGATAAPAPAPVAAPTPVAARVPAPGAARPSAAPNPAGVALLPSTDHEGEEEEEEEDKEEERDEQEVRDDRNVEEDIGDEGEDERRGDAGDGESEDDENEAGEEEAEEG